MHALAAWSGPSDSHYTACDSTGRRALQMPGFVWVSDEMEMDGRHYSRTGLVWTLEERKKETVTGLDPVPKKVEAPKQRNLPTQTQHPPEPLKALIDVVMLPFDFLIYPGRRDW
jgi:hypothetical protein